MKTLTTVLRLSRPVHLALGVLTYLLGASLAAYLGNPFASAPFWTGLIGILMALISMFLLNEIFRPAADPILPDETMVSRKRLHDVLLYTVFACLAASVLSNFIIFNMGRLSVFALLLSALLLILSLVFSIPPFRLVNRGFGELILAILLAYIVPSISFLLQADTFHRYLAMLVFPLTCLALATFIALDFPSYARDRKYSRGTLLVRLGWERAVPVHHVLIILAYLLILSAPLFGISISLIWPGLITAPFAVFQVYSLHRITLGGKPVWNLLTLTAIGIFALTTYFLALTFWLH